MSEELLVYRLLSLHNLYYFLGLMAAMRAAIAAGAFTSFRTRFLDRYPVTLRPEANAAE
jgi:queuine tRNA-ribosyltransferase